MTSYANLSAVLLSVAIAVFVMLRFWKTAKPHLAIWGLGWAIVAARSALGLVWPTGKVALHSYVYDLMTVGADVVLFVGLAAALKMSGDWRITFPTAYFAIHAVASALLYFADGSIVAGSVETRLFAHPAMLLVLAYYFHIAAKDSRNWGTALVSATFLLWALNNIAFGTPYYGAGDPVAGALGWTIAAIIRVALLAGFLKMTYWDKPKTGSSAE